MYIAPPSTAADNTGAIIGGIVGAILGILVIILIISITVVMCCCKRTVGGQGTRGTINIVVLMVLIATFFLFGLVWCGKLI